MRTAGGLVALSVAALGGSCIAPPPFAVAAPAPPPLARPVAAPVATITSAPGIAVIGDPGQGAVLLGNLTGGARNLTLDGMPVRVAPDGRFIVAFNQDAGPQSMLRATLPNGRATELRLAVAPRAWRVEVVGSIPRFTQPSAEFARLRPPELAMINAARRVNAEADGWRQRFVWPVKGRVSGLFGSSRVYANGEKGAPHSGVDVARQTGTPVVAPADGVVTLAAPRPFTLEGNILIVDHGMGLNSAFLHLSRIDVASGQRVRQGQVVGSVGSTGRSSGPHLHWGMKWLDRRIDPLLLAGPM